MQTSNPRLGNGADPSPNTGIQSQSRAYPSIDVSTAMASFQYAHSHKTDASDSKSLARALIVPYPPSSHHAYDSSPTSYIPLAYALSSSSYHPHGDPSAVFPSSQSLYLADIQSRDSRTNNHPGARPFVGQRTFNSFWSSKGQDPRLGVHLSYNMDFTSAGGNVAAASSNHYADKAPFIGPSAAHESALDRPMGRAFTLPPTSAPPTFPVAKTTPPFGFSKWANGSECSTFLSSVSSKTAVPIFNAPSLNVAPENGTGSEVPVSVTREENQQEPRVKVEDDQMNEDIQPPPEASGADLVSVPRDIKSGYSTNMNEIRSALAPSSTNSSTHPKVIRAFPSLGSLDLATLTASQTLFYFGVLTTQALLLPRFEFDRETGGRWGVKLTMYGYTLSKPELFGSQVGVKVEVCREALEILKTQYPQWVVPDEPRECLTNAEWNWIQLLNGKT